MKRMEVLEKTQELVDGLQASHELHEMKELEMKLLSDASVMQLISEFQAVNQSYQEALKYGSYHPDLERLKKDLMEKKTELFSIELFRQYKEKEMEVDFLVTDLTNLLMDLIRTDESVCHPNKG